MEPFEKYSYPYFREKLQAEGIPVVPAEVHGLLAGLHCSDAGFTPQQALQEMLAQTSLQWSAEFNLFLNDYFKKVHLSLIGNELGFDLLLPEDELPLAERAKHLAQWCQGFLFGIGLGGKKNHSKQTQEILRDIQAISQLEAEGDGEAEEQAYFELVEFLRVATQLLFTENELDKRRGKSSGN